MPERQTTRRASRISTRLRRALDDFTNRYGALRTFDAYVDVGAYPEVIELFDGVLPRLSETPRKYGLDKDIPLKLKKWKQSARKRLKTSRAGT